MMAKMKCCSAVSRSSGVLELLMLLITISVALSNPASKRSEVKRDHCNKTVDIYEDVSSPEVTAENFGRPMTCWYRFRSFRGSPKDWILRIRFKKFKVGTLVNATTCHMGYMQIVDGNAKTDVSNRKDPGLFCGETEQPQTFISETSFVKILFHTDNFTDQTYFSFDSRAEQQFEVYLRYGQHPELYPNRRGEVVAGSYCERVFRDCRLQTCYVQSPAYPGVYPRHLHCRYHLNTRLPFIKLYIENEEFNIDGQRCENIMTCPMRPITSGSEHCPYDYIRIYDGKDEGSPVIGTFCGMGKFPYSIIGTSQDLFVEFVSSPAGPLLNTGFHFNVGNWPGHVETAGSRNGTCDWLLTSESLQRSGDTEGIFLSVAHWYPPHTSCTYLMQGLPNQIIRLYFPSFRINRIESPIKPFDGDCGESLTIYDASWPDDSRIIKTFCDTFSKPMEKHDFVSTGNSLFVRFESKTGSYSGSSLYYWAHYDFFNNTRYGEPVPGTRCDEVLASWRASKGFLRSPPNTLVYKRPGQDVSCLYRFVTDRRLFARVILNIVNINFKEHPYTSAPCQNCYEDRADKLVIWEPLPAFTNNQSNTPHTPTPLHTVMQKGAGTCLCTKHAPLISINKPYQVISLSEQLNLQLIVDSAHAASSYFKHQAPLFEATYEFIHSPLCGPATIEPTADGEIMFPYLDALGYTDPPKDIRCIWDMRINRDRDLWIHIDKIKFASKNCDDGKLEIYLPGQIDPYITICGENVSLAKELPILSASELGVESIEDFAMLDDTRAIRIQFMSATSPTRAAFKIGWTELYHLPRNSDGTLQTSRLVEGISIDSKYNSEYGHDKRSIEVCDFLCPGDNGLCIPLRLVCNGVVNCPNSTSHKDKNNYGKTNTEARFNYIEENLRKIGFTGELTLKMLETLSDESPEICNSRTESAVVMNWMGVGLGAIGGLILGIACLIVLCKICCHKRSTNEPDLGY